MLEAIAECQSFVAGMTVQQFRDDAKSLKAVTWNLALIGEAARHIPPQVVSLEPLQAPGQPNGQT